MKKVLSLLLALVMIVGLLPLTAMNASAAEESATITFNNVSKRTAFDTSHQVWEENGIVVTNNKGSSTSNVANYSNPARFYKNSELIVEYGGNELSKIAFTCNTTAYATSLKNSIGANVTVSGKVVTVTLAAGTTAFTVKLTDGQVRMDSLTVTANIGGSDCDHAETMPGDDGRAATCTEDGQTASIVCAECDAIVVAGTVIPALGHTYVDNICTVCGDEKFEAPLMTTTPVSGDIVAIYCSGYALAPTASGTKMAGTKVTITNDVLTGNGQVAKVAVGMDSGYYTLSIDGKYLTTGATGGNLSLSDTLSDLGRWTITANTTNTWYITNVGAAYNNNHNQALEYYSGFTTYGKQTTDAFKIQLFLIAGGDCQHADTEIIGGTAATCTTAGSTDSVVCVECGATVVAPETIPALGHNFVDGACANCSIPDPAVGRTIVTEVEGGVAYKMVIDQKGLGQFLFFAGTTESASTTYRLATTDNKDEAVDVYLVEVEGGYQLYFMDGDTQTFIRVWEREDATDAGYGKGTLELTTTQPTEVFTFDATANTLVYSDGADDSYYMGTYGTYNTISVSNASYISGDKASAVDTTQFPVRFATYTEPEPEVPENSAENPYYVEWIWNDAQTEATASVTVAAGTTYYCASYITGLEMFINGTSYGMLTGSRWEPAKFTLVNDTDAEATYELKIVVPVGTMDNPAELVMGENTATVAEGAQGYFYTWTAEKDGTLTITMPEGNWVYAINNLTSYAYGDTQWSDSDPVVNPAKVEVKAGDVLQIMVNTYDPANEWVAPAGTLTITAAFEEPIEKFDIDVARMILGNALEFQFGVATSKIPDTTGYYAVIEKTWADGTTTEKTIPAAEWGQSGQYWAIVYDGLAAKEMGDTFYVTIYNADGVAISNAKEDSVRAYVERAYDSQSAAGKTMMVDMLNYGAAAQVHFGYGTEDLANNQLTDAQKASGTATAPEMSNDQVKGTNYQGSRFILESRIQVQLAFKNMTTDMYAVYTYTNAAGKEQTVKVEGADFVMINGAPAGVELSELVYADARALVEVTVYNADGTVYGTATDSIESCAYRSNGDVFTALMKFADSAKAHLYG